jgi:hypothetical protein
MDKRRYNKWQTKSKLMGRSWKKAFISGGEGRGASRFEQ